MSLYNVQRSNTGDVYAAGIVSGDLNALALLVHDDGVTLNSLSARQMFSSFPDLGSIRNQNSFTQRLIRD